MERQRDSLVPIGEAISGPGDPVEAIHSASPQASHHFTQADQVNQLVGASEASPDLVLSGAQGRGLLRGARRWRQVGLAPDPREVVPRDGKEFS